MRKQSGFGHLEMHPGREQFHQLNAAGFITGSLHRSVGFFQQSTRIPYGFIRSVLLSTDDVPASMVDDIEGVWSCNVNQHYGMTEMGYESGVECGRSKRNHIFEELRNHGFTEADWERVHSPIGLEIDAETPAEIALSIVAELVKIRAKGRRP